MKDGLASMDENVRAEWEAVRAETEKQLAWLALQMSIGGNAAGDAFMNALASAMSTNPTPGYGGEVGPKQPGYGGGGVPGYAAGTLYNEMAGYYDVGERGRERVYLPQGAAVVPHDQLVGGGTTINMGGITVNPGSDVSLGAAKRFGQTILDEVAKGLQQQGSRYSEFSGSRA